MATGRSPRLPLSTSDEDGFTMNKTILQVCHQNLKMLLLTNPGERVMDAKYGVGLKTFLFEQNVPGSHTKIDMRIREQVSKYMPYIRIDNIKYNQTLDTWERDAFPNVLFIKVTYTVLSTAQTATMELPIS